MVFNGYKRPCVRHLLLFLTNTQWIFALQWRHNDRDGVSNHQPHDCLLNLLFRRRSKKTSKLRLTGLMISGFPVQRASNAENVSIWWRHERQFVKVLIRWFIAFNKTNELYSISPNAIWGPGMRITKSISPVLSYFSTSPKFMLVIE